MKKILFITIIIFSLFVLHNIVYSINDNLTERFVTEQSYTCEDTDQGIKPNQKGELYLILNRLNLNKKILSKKDFCFGKSNQYLIEYFCKEKQPQSTNELFCFNVYKCDCQDGECKNEPQTINSRCTNDFNHNLDNFTESLVIDQTQSSNIDNENLKNQNFIEPTILSDSVSNLPNLKSKKDRKQVSDVIIEPKYDIELSQNPSSVFGFLMIILKPYQVIDKAELFLKRENSVDKLFAGSFKQKQAFWNLSIDTTQFPNANYELLLNINMTGRVFESTAGNITINNIIKSEPEKIASVLESKVNQLAASKITKEELKKEIRLELNTIQNIKENIEKNKISDQLPLDQKVREELKQIEQLKQKEAPGEVLDKELPIKDTIQNIKENIEKNKISDQLPLDQKVREELKQIEQLKQKEAPGEVLDKELPKKEEKNIELTLQPEIETIKKAILDFDNDGLTNKDELRYNTDPFNPDSDNDGYLDGIEVKNNYNPLSEKSEDKIQFESPKISGIENTEVYKVEKVEIVDTKLKLEGKGLPNSFVTIFIYSEPIIVTVKTDANGNWSYILDKDLTDGYHEVYIAITNNTGKVIEKSSAFSFIKTAQAISIVDAPQNDISPLNDTADNLILDPQENPIVSAKFPYWMFLLFLIGLGVLLILIILTIIAKTHVSDKE